MGTASISLSLTYEAKRVKWPDITGQSKRPMPRKIKKIDSNPKDNQLCRRHLPRSCGGTRVPIAIIGIGTAGGPVATVAIASASVEATIVEATIVEATIVGATSVRAAAAVAVVLGNQRVGALGLVVAHLLAVAALDTRDCGIIVSKQADISTAPA